MNLEEEVRALKVIRDLGRQAVYQFPGQAYDPKLHVHSKAPDIDLEILLALEKDGLIRRIAPDLWEITPRGIATLEGFQGGRR